MFCIVCSVKCVIAHFELQTQHCIYCGFVDLFSYMNAEQVNSFETVKLYVKLKIT